MPNQSIISNKNLAILTLLVLSIQLCGFEGTAVSLYKVIYMGTTPLLLLTRSPKVSKAIILSILFWGVTFLLMIIQYENQRLSTLYYSLFYLSTFCLFYNLVWVEHAFQLQDAINTIKFFIHLYVIVLLLQQAFLLVGIRSFYLINLYPTRWQSLFHLSSLAIEPSQAARLMTVYMYAFLKLHEFNNGRPISVKELFGVHKWTIYGFIYFMFAIGSGTAMVCLSILLLYFIRKQYVMLIVILAFSFYFIVPYVNYEPLTRAMDTFDATLTLDESEVSKTDQSASTRVNQLISLKYTDFSDEMTWFGHGIDAIHKGPITLKVIYDYGLISYILKLLLYFSCALCGLYSLSTLMFIIIFSMNIGNVAYCFAALMVFSLVKYFQQFVPNGVK